MMRNPESRAKFSFWFLTVAVVLTELVLTGVGWNANAFHRQLTAVSSRNLRIEELRGVILYLDEVLTMSARMAAATGHPKWETRYKQFELRLDAAIREVGRLVPDAWKDDTAKKTDAANRALVEMDYRAFRLVEQGRLTEAQELLASDAYEAQKRIYSDGMAQLNVRLMEAEQALMRSTERKTLINVISVIIAVPCCLIGWLFVLREMRRRQGQLIASNRALDQRVSERTKELESSRATALESMRRAEEATKTLERVNEDLPQEIAQRKRIEDDLRQARARTEHLLSSITSILISVDGSGVVTYWNDVATATLGMPAERVIRRPLADSGIRWSMETVTRGVDACQISGEPTRLPDLMFTRPDGREGILGLTVIPIRGVGAKGELLLFGAEITERRRAEQRVSAQHAATRVIAESADFDEASRAILQSLCEAAGWDAGSVWMMDRSAGVLRVMQRWHRPAVEIGAFEAASQMAWVPGQGLPGRIFSSGTPAWIEHVSKDPGFVRAKAAADSGLRSGVGVPISHNGEVFGVLEFFSRDVRRPDDDAMQMLASIGSQMGQFVERKRLEAQRREQAEALERGNEELTRREKVMQSLLEDLQTSKDQLETQQTILQTANRQLQELSVVKDEFVATVSHELRTPLTAIKEGISLLLDDALGDINAEQRDFLQTVDDNIERLTELISNMLDLSKIEAGRFRLFRRRLRIQRVLEAAMSNYKPMAGQRALRLHVGDVPDVFADPNRILQVLGNLLSNAMKFTKDSNGAIDVSAGASDGYLEISVHDNGVGIAKDDVAKLFRRFSQVGEGQGRPRGTGLGLALCKELIELHHGSIRVASEPGRGSAFIITLPTYTARFSLEASFEELLEFAKQNHDECIGLVALDCRPLLGEFAQRLAELDDEARSAPLSPLDALEGVGELVRKHLHRGDVVLSIEPAWVVVLAIADGLGTDAIVQRLTSAITKQAQQFGLQVPVRFGTASFPADSQDVQVLFEKATGGRLEPSGVAQVSG